MPNDERENLGGMMNPEQDELQVFFDKDNKITVARAHDQEYDVFGDKVGENKSEDGIKAVEAEDNGDESHEEPEIEADEERQSNMDNPDYNQTRDLHLSQTC